MNLGWKAVNDARVLSCLYWRAGHAGTGFQLYNYSVIIIIELQLRKLKGNWNTCWWLLLRDTLHNMSQLYQALECSTKHCKITVIQTLLPHSPKEKSNTRLHHVHNVLSIVHLVWHLTVTVRKYVLHILFTLNKVCLQQSGMAWPYLP